MKNKSFLTLALGLVLSFALGAFIAQAADVPEHTMTISAVIVLLGAIPKGEAAGSLLMATPDTSALSAYAGKHEKKLFRTLIAAMTILKDLTVIPGIKNTLKLTKLTVKDGIRGYREDFDSSDDDLSYSGRDLVVELLKRDMKINPLKYRNTWMSEVMKPGVNIDDIPFAAFVNESILKQIASEVNRGAYLAVKGDMSTLLKSFDGLGTLIAAAIAAETAVAGTGIVPVATGALTNTNAVAKFELLTASMPSEFLDEGFEIKCAIDQFRLYNEDYRERYKKYVEMNTDGTYTIDNTGGKVKIKPCTWMGTSKRLIASPFENLLAGVDGLGDMDKIHTDVELEIIKYRILFALGFQIRDLKAIRVNDQA